MTRKDLEEKVRGVLENYRYYCGDDSNGNYDEDKATAAILKLIDEEKKILEDVVITMKHARVFIISREKMHPNGVELYDKLLSDIQRILGVKE